MRLVVGEFSWKTRARLAPARPLALAPGEHQNWAQFIAP